MIRVHSARPSWGTLTSGRVPRWALWTAGSAAYIGLSILAHWVAGDFGTTQLVSVWFPPSGLMLALLVVAGPRWVPLAFVGRIAGSYLGAHTTSPWWRAVAGAAAVSITYALAAAGLLRVMRGRRFLGGTADMAMVIGFGLLASLVAAVLLAGLMWAEVGQVASGFGPALWRYFVGDATGILTIIPVTLWLVGWRPTARRRPLSWLDGAEAVAQAVAIVGLSWYAVSGGVNSDHYYPALLPVVWVALRRGLPGACLAVAAESISLAVLANRHGIPAHSITSLGVFILVAGVVGLGVGGRETERKAGREALERSAAKLTAANLELELAHEMKDHFIATASHELRTPVTSIVGFAEVLRTRGDTLDPARQADFLERIERGGRRLNLLVEDLLILSLGDAGHLSVHPSSVAVADLVDEIRHNHAADGVEAEVDLSADLRVWADPDRLVQILGNYLTNALRHGRPPITITGRRHGELVEIRVQDSGAGVPPEFVSQLFERFTQALGRSVGQGTGLGLAVASTLARANGGEAFYEPASSGGSVFGVRLPVDSAGGGHALGADDLAQLVHSPA